MLRGVRDGSRWRRTALACGLGAAALALTAAPLAAERSDPARKGIALARQGDCVAAVPLLEEAELRGSRPAVASALAGCEVALGELLAAYERYRALAALAPRAGWSRADRSAHASAAARRDELDARLPQISWVIAPAVADVSGTVAGRPIDDWGAALRVAPDEPLEISISAAGFEPYRESIVLSEGEERVVSVRLVPSPARSKTSSVPRAPADSSGTTHWLGSRFRGVLLPEFMTDWLAEGGRTTFWPGGALTYTAGLGHVDVVTSLQVLAHPLSSTPFKPVGTPDTEWEVVQSDLWSGVASVDVLYRIELDDAGDVALRLGAGIGIGWAFAGQVRRWQSYSPTGRPGDPYSYPKCRAPNDPVGSFRYCNALDKDATRYGEADASWFDGGIRPTVFPWLVLPVVGLDVVVDGDVGLEFEVGATLTGLLTGVGVRFGL